MDEYKSGIYGKPKFGLIVWLFAIAIPLALFAAWLLLRTGHPAMHVVPQPKDNKGALILPLKSIAA